MQIVVGLWHTHRGTVSQVVIGLWHTYRGTVSQVVIGLWRTHRGMVSQIVVGLWHTQRGTVTQIVIGLRYAQRRTVSQIVIGLQYAQRRTVNQIVIGLQHTHRGTVSQIVIGLQHPRMFSLCLLGFMSKACVSAVGGNLMLRVPKQKEPFWSSSSCVLKVQFLFLTLKMRRERQRTVNQESKNPVTESFFKLVSWLGLAQGLEYRTHGFESWQEWQYTFLLCGQLSVLTRTSIPIPPLCYCSSM